MIDVFFIPIMLTALVVGAGTGLLGVQIVGMRIPLLGVVISHAAMVGAVTAHVIGLPPACIMPAAALCSMAAAIPLGVLRPQRTRIDINVLMGILFSLTMGLAFLAIGLSSREQNTVLGLLWGSLNFVTTLDLIIISATFTLLAAFVALFHKELRAILFSRQLARAGGVHESAVWTAYLVLAALTLSVNLSTVGGLMLFSLLSTPAVAAAQLARSDPAMLLWSASLAAASALLGFLAAYALGFPTGASIVLTSSLILAASFLVRRYLRKP